MREPVWQSSGTETDREEMAMNDSEYSGSWILWWCTMLSLGIFITMFIVMGGVVG